ncbi:MAG: hypothetical protein ACOYO0_01985 [Sandarakinorhabdus sp.]
MASFDQIKRKVMRPPSAQNWTRLNAFGDLEKTTLLIANFAVGVPAFNYIPAVGACKHKVELGLDLDTAVKSVRRSGAPAGRESNESLVRAFYDYDGERQYGSKGFAESFDDGAFRVSRDVRVPTKPTFTTLDSGLLCPVLICGWQEFPFDLTHTRLFMTVLELGLFSFADYRRSPAEVVLFPMDGEGDDRRRLPKILKRGDYELLPEKQLREQSELYIEAQTAALPIAEDVWRKRDEKRKKEESASTPAFVFDADPDLFRR